MIVNRFIYACLYRGTASYLEKVEKVLTPQNEIQNQLRAKQLYRPVPVQRRDQFFVRTVDS